MQIFRYRVTYLTAALMAAFLGIGLIPSAAQLLRQGQAYPVRFALPAAATALNFSPLADAGAGADAGVGVVDAGDAPPTDTGPADTSFGLGGGPASSAFSAAFASFPARSAQAPTLPSPSNGGSSAVLPIHYSLAELPKQAGEIAVQSRGALSGTLDVQKPVQVGAAPPARIDVKIGSGANIYLNGAQLAALLSAQGRRLKSTAPIGKDGFVSLDDLRSSGLKIRYDAAKDSLVVDGEG